MEFVSTENIVVFMKLQSGRTAISSEDNPMSMPLGISRIMFCSVSVILMILIQAPDLGVGLLSKINVRF